MVGNLTGWHLVIILAVILLLFGAPKLPGLARSIGQSMRIFRSEVKTMKDENAPAATDAPSTPDIPGAPTVSETPSVIDTPGTASPESKPKP